MEYTLADLAKLTGLKPRTLQLWAEGGVLRVDEVHGGSGRYRRYGRREAIIACLMVPFHRLQMTIGQLVLISADIRAVLTGGGDGQVTWEDIEDCVAGIRRVRMIVHALEKGHGISFHVEDQGDKAKNSMAAVGALVTQYEDEPAAISLTLLVNQHVKPLR